MALALELGVGEMEGGRDSEERRKRRMNIYVEGRGMRTPLTNGSPDPFVLFLFFLFQTTNSTTLHQTHKPPFL